MASRTQKAERAALRHMARRDNRVKPSTYAELNKQAARDFTFLVYLFLGIGAVAWIVFGIAMVLR